MRAYVKFKSSGTVPLYQACIKNKVVVTMGLWMLLMILYPMKLCTSKGCPIAPLKVKCYSKTKHKFYAAYAKKNMPINNSFLYARMYIHTYISKRLTVFQCLVQVYRDEVQYKLFCLNWHIHTVLLR